MARQTLPSVSTATHQPYGQLQYDRTPAVEQDQIDFTDDDVRYELSKLGFNNIPTHILQEFMIRLKNRIKQKEIEEHRSIRVQAYETDIERRRKQEIDNLLRSP